MCRGRRARILLHLHIQLEGAVLQQSRAGQRCGCRMKPSILCACVREEDAGGREAGAHSTTPTYTVRRDSPATEQSWSALWLQKQRQRRSHLRDESTIAVNSGFSHGLVQMVRYGHSLVQMVRYGPI
jgi:hypothetical protein